MTDELKTLSEQSEELKGEKLLKALEKVNKGLEDLAEQIREIKKSQ